MKVDFNCTMVYNAVEEAKKSTYLQFRTGCIIFNKKRILSVGHNYASKSAKKLHPKFQTWFGSVHAEVDAILKARKNLKNASLIVIRINKKDEFRMSKPCKHCMLYLNHIGIKKIYYSISNFPYIKKV